ncbi:unnamed protein product [Macrosiphum euphorbiae]|uniref:Signal peptidase complex catalytic subunit SEC11 n=1 Tax=Macrosiphum euphorbiae TaxID=13131 RepID=A0AAV0XUL4_9HEMI|nr:unnamed protein product [Macrosiphum euphorbiae]
MFERFVDDLKRTNKRKVLYRVLFFGMMISVTSMIWSGLKVFTGSESPIIVISSGSMEPAFHRGDILFLTNYEEEPLRVGEIVVFKIEGRYTPIMHRVLKLHEKRDGTIKFLTKGDNNSEDDRVLYAPGQQWLEKSDIIGKARGFVPYIGMLKMLTQEYPIVKFAILVYIGLNVLVHRE